MRDEARHPWVKGNLRIRRATLELVFDEARRAYADDEESCGLLVGPESQPLLVDGIEPMKNRANMLHALDPSTYPRTGRTYFDIDSMKFEGAISRGEANGRPVKVLYHSHLDAGAYFSATDAEVAKMGGDAPPYDLAYLVTSVDHGKIRAHKLFAWDPESRAFVESPLMVAEDE